MSATQQSVKDLIPLLGGGHNLDALLHQLNDLDSRLQVVAVILLCNYRELVYCRELRGGKLDCVRLCVMQLRSNRSRYPADEELFHEPGR
jgi:hypothetical protein